MARLFAVVVLVLSLLMLIPVLQSAMAMARGAEVPPASWGIPLVILAMGAFLIWLLSRKQVSMQHFVLAFSLWVIAAGYVFVRFV